MDKLGVNFSAFVRIPSVPRDKLHFFAFLDEPEMTDEETDAMIYSSVLLRWKKTVKDYENEQSFLNAYAYISSHPIFWSFRGDEFSLDAWRHSAEAIKLVNLNVALKQNSSEHFFFIETGPVAWGLTDDFKFWARETNDLNLAVTADSFEEVFVKLAGLIHRFYGNDRTKV